MNTVVLRVEDRHFIGPYTEDIPGLRDGFDSSRPTPLEDGITEIDQNEYCGFNRIGDVVDWFGKDDLVTLSKSGMRVVLITVPDVDVRYGDHQLVFTERTRGELEREVLSWSRLLKYADIRIAKKSVGSTNSTKG